MTRNNPNYDRSRRVSKMADNVLRETADATELVCGHFARSQPIAIYPSQRKLYDCPEGCGLQKDKAR